MMFLKTKNLNELPIDVLAAIAIDVLMNWGI